MKKHLFTLFCLGALLALTSCGSNQGNRFNEADYTKVSVDLSNISTINAGTLIRDSEQKLIDYINKDKEDLITSIPCSSASEIFAAIEEDGSASNRIKIGTSSSNGKLTFDFGVNLKKIVVKARAYYKYDSFNKVMNISHDSSLDITSGKKYSNLNLKNDGSEKPKIRQKGIVFNDTVTTVSFTSHSRVYLEGLDFYF